METNKKEDIYAKYKNIEYIKKYYHKNIPNKTNNITITANKLNSSKTLQNKDKALIIDNKKIKNHISKKVLPKSKKKSKHSITKNEGNISKRNVNDIYNKSSNITKRNIGSPTNNEKIVANDNIYNKKIIVSSLISNSKNFNSSNGSNKELVAHLPVNYLTKNKESVNSITKESCLNELSRTYVQSNYNNNSKESTGSLLSNRFFNKSKINSIFKYYKSIKKGYSKTNRGKSNNININNYNTYNIITLNKELENAVHPQNKIRNYLIDGHFSNIYSSSHKNMPSGNHKQKKSQKIIENNKIIQSKDSKKGEKYKILYEIGSGSYSRVCSAIHIDSGKTVAIKVYDKDLNSSKTRTKSIKREITILSMVNHKNIIKFLDCFSDDEFIYLVMEIVEGKNLFEILREHFKEKKKLKYSFIIELMNQVLSTLDYLHDKGICHRDIKLENIMYIEDQNLFKLIDFGFSTRINSQEKLNIYCGTPSYMSPSLIKKEPSDGFKNDVWAIGVLFYVLVKGKFPFKAKNDKELYYNITNNTIKSRNKKLNYIFSIIFEKDEDKRSTIKHLKHIFFEFFKNY